MQKHRISTNIGKEQKVTVELKQDYDQLEILSLKFSQTDVYTSQKPIAIDRSFTANKV